MKVEQCINKVICGESLEELTKLPAGSVNCGISSPPYWALRDYGVDGQLGLEKTFEAYIDKLCTIYDEVRRVLRKDGTCFVNLGDTYNNVTPGGRDENRWPKQSRNDHTPNMRSLPANIQVKSLCLIPQRFAIEMVNRGWILRNVIIWHKPNPMPSSAKDRFTVDFEYVYFFVKSRKYWFEPQYEPHNTPIHLQEKRVQAAVDAKTKRVMSGDGDALEKWSIKKPEGQRINPLGRNKRTVWTIPTQAYSEAHFATFPEKLVTPMIKSGCPEFVCTKCGKGREKIYEPSEQYAQRLGKSWHDHKDDDSRGQRYTRDIAGAPCTADYRFKGYSDCGCGAEWRPGIVLDCFCWVRDGRQGSCSVAA